MSLFNNRSLQFLFFAQLFDEVQDKTSKVEAIVTDFEANEIVTPADCKRISQEVNVVFHVLATIKFNEPLQDAVRINMVNTQKIVKMCHDIEALKSFIHVSTMFSNSNRDQEINEEIYDHPLDYKQLLAIGGLQSKISVKSQPVGLNLQHDFPNTYTLTKHFAEKLVVDQAKNLPFGIFRPPIVISSYKNVPGWVDNINTLAALAVGFTKGHGRVALVRPDNPLHACPVDYCMNAIIAAAWDVSQKFRKDDQLSIPIYNYASGTNNKTYGEAFSLFKRGFHEPLTGASKYYFVLKTTDRFSYAAINAALAMFPARVMDTIAAIQGMKGKNYKNAKIFKGVTDGYAFFMTTPFRFNSKNVPALVGRVEQTERHKSSFEFDVRKVDWNRFYYNYIPGLRKFVFKGK